MKKARGGGEQKTGDAASHLMAVDRYQFQNLLLLLLFHANAFPYIGGAPTPCANSFQFSQKMQLVSKRLQPHIIDKVHINIYKVTYLEVYAVYVYFVWRGLGPFQSPD